MKLTKKQREQVVELLRCAADMDPLDPRPDYPNGIVIASWHLGRRDAMSFARICSTESIAERAVSNVPLAPQLWRWRLLEAAQRVEEGSWP